VKQLEVTIMGQSYLLGCPQGGESALLEAVGHVDREMSAIRDGGKIKARERIAVLAALNLAYALAERPDPVPAGVPVDTETEHAIEALVKRLDSALNADGQLL